MILDEARPDSSGRRASTHVLVAAYDRQPFWSLPAPLGERLQAEFPEVAWSHVPRWFDEGFGGALAEADVFFGWHLPPAEFARAARLRWVHSAATGVRRFLYPGLVDSDVVLTSSRGVQAPYMAEHVMAWLLAWTRRLHGLCFAQDEVRWSQDEVLAEHPPASVIGMTLLLVGYGATGRELAARARPFGMRVIGVKRRPSEGGEGADEVHGLEALDRLLPLTDVVVNMLPNTAGTALFDAARLARMRPSALFFNVGRGATVDETALAAMLSSGRLAAAGLDVFREEPLPASSPLWELPNVMISPHLAGAAHPALWPRLVDLFARNLRAFLDGRPLENVVDKREGY